MIFDKIEGAFLRWNAQFKGRLLAACPPGYEMKGEYRVFWVWLFVSIGYSFKFLINYTEAHRNLFRFGADGALVLDTQMRMPAFSTLLEDSMLWFGMSVLFLLFVIFLHYNYYRKDSKSIYVMKRLKSRKILQKTYIITPLIYGVILIMTCAFLTGLYYLVYRFVTPQECLNIGGI